MVEWGCRFAGRKIHLNEQNQSNIHQVISALCQAQTTSGALKEHSREGGGGRQRGQASVLSSPSLPQSTGSSLRPGERAQRARCCEGPQTPAPENAIDGELRSDGPRGEVPQQRGAR